MSASNHPQTRKQRHTMILAGSMFGGLLAAIALVTIPFAGARESVITGAILLGFALGWALLAGLSARFTDKPQRWALVPAAAMALTAAGLLAFEPGSAAITSLGWVWPPLLAALVVWMVVSARRDAPSTSRRWLLYPVFAVLALVAFGGGYETLRNATDPTVALAAGHRLVDVGGHRLDITCTGTGGPTVVLEPGLGETSSAMSRWIAPDVARTTRICSYDQAGHGLSEPAPGGNADAARDLHVLLERSGVPGPYVIAGHSLGGLFALSYADRYPEQVAGIVLLDSMHPHQSSPLAGASSLLAVVPTLARTGIARLFLDPKDGSPTAQARQFALDVERMLGEQNRAAQLRSLGGRPLIVVTAGKGNASGWGAQQDDLATLSSSSDHRTVAGATHQSLIDDESDAAASGKAIRDIVSSVRSEPTS